MTTYIPARADYYDREIVRRTENVIAESHRILALPYWSRIDLQPVAAVAPSFPLTDDELFVRLCADLPNLRHG